MFLSASKVLNEMLKHLGDSKKKKNLYLYHCFLFIIIIFNKSVHNIKKDCCDEHIPMSFVVYLQLFISGKIDLFHRRDIIKQCSGIKENCLF